MLPWLKNTFFEQIWSRKSKLFVMKVQKREYVKFDVSVHLSCLGQETPYLSQIGLKTHNCLLKTEVGT